MPHAITLFAGSRAALRPFVELVPGTTIYALTPAATVFVLPVGEALLDALHDRNGTGEWLDEPTHPLGAPPRLTTRDVAFAAQASRDTALAYLETCYQGGNGWQSAAVWIDGGMAMRPALAHTSEHRPAKLLPINGALRLLGITARYAAPDDDEFTVFGLADYRSNARILAHAQPAKV